MKFSDGTEFPSIGDQPYLLTLGALSFYWLSLEARQVRQESVPSEASRPSLPLVALDAFDEVFQGRSLAVLLRILPEFLKTRRWFLGKNRSIRAIDILDTITITDTASQILLGQIEYSEGDPEIYVLPGSVAVGEAMDQVKAKLSDVAVMHLREPGGQEEFCTARSGIRRSAMRCWAPSQEGGASAGASENWPDRTPARFVRHGANATRSSRPLFSVPNKPIRPSSLATALF